jgi:hypothetical protein
VDEKGRWWFGKVCPECSNRRRVEYTRRTGRRKARKDVTELRSKVGFDSEVAAKMFFESYGYIVVQSTAWGPDLIVSKQNLMFTVEVKTVIQGTRNQKFVNKVCINRLHDDFIAYVTKDKRIYITNMKDHLLHCDSTGKRTITSLLPEFLSS